MYANIVEETSPIHDSWNYIRGDDVVGVVK